MANIDVSIVIVCMNNLKNLYPCLNSIKQYTEVTYETFVVAYLFDEENLRKVKADFPWVTFIESNEIRGFAENNNLALKKAHGKYCFVVNDDTELRMPVIDRLLVDFDMLSSKAAILSPKILDSTGNINSCGNKPTNLFLNVLAVFRLNKYLYNNYVNGTGLFKTYNIVGSAFLIKTDIFKQIGWFDEKYFFCPEDIVVSETINKLGYECWVDSDVEIIHFEGMSCKSLSMTQAATKPAAYMGGIIHFSDGKLWKQIYVRPIMMFLVLFQSAFHGVVYFLGKETYHKILCIGYWRCVLTTFSSKTPKQIFIKYFKK